MPIAKRFALYILLPLLSLTACKQGQQGAAGQSGAPKPYGVMEVAPQSTTLHAEFPATLQGVQNVDIRPKIDGYIEKILVDEGATVRQGQILFLISNPQYDEDVRNAQAAIKSAEADVATAQLLVKKTQPLVEKDIISEYDLESANLALEAKKAALLQAKTRLSNAQINLGYTKVASPVNGIMGTIPYRIGSYVNSTTAQPLTTVSDVSKIYAYFSIDQKKILQMQKGAHEMSLATIVKQLPEVSLILSDGSKFNSAGKVEMVSGQINVQTGAFNVRADFPNQEGLLRSGGNATIIIPSHIENAILIPQNATYELQGKKFVFTIDSENKTVAHEITVRDVPGGQLYVVDTGLKSGDKIVIEGVGILQEGTIVEPQLASRDSVLSKSLKK